MKALIQTGSSGRMPVPPEKRFLINSWENNQKGKKSKKPIMNFCHERARKNTKTYGFVPSHAIFLFVSFYGYGDFF